MKKECKNCQKSFEPERVNQIYCSNSCKQKAYKERENKKNELLEKREFSLNEYEFCQNKLSDYFGDDLSHDLDPIMYFYLTQHYKETDLKKKAEYIISMSHFGRSNFSRYRKMQEFLDFERNYLNGSFVLNAITWTR